MAIYHSLCRVILGVQVFGMLAFGPVSAQAEKLTAHISFVEIQSQENDTSKIHRQPRKINLTIKDEHRVEEWSARRADKPDQHSLNFESVLGSRTKVQNTVVEWRFEGRNLLVRETEFPSFYERIKIVYRSNKCDATVDYALKANSSRFGMWALDGGKPTSYQSVHAEDVVCKVDEDSVS